MTLIKTMVVFLQTRFLRILNHIIMSKEDKLQEEEIENVETQETEDSIEEVQEEVIELSREESLEIQVKEATDKYLRLYSEFDNFRKRRPARDVRPMHQVFSSKRYRLAAKENALRGM